MPVEIGEIRGIIALQDNFSAGAKGIIDEIEGLGASFKAITGFAGLVAGGITATAASIIALGASGAEVADVQGAFDDLSKSVGSTGQAMLGELQKGTLGTISNFELMKRANEVLGSGMVSSAKDMGTLAAGAQLLGDRTGKGTAAAFDILTSAIEKGKTAGLKQLGVFVDNATAVDQYAQKIGKSVGDLNDQERAQALSAASLAALNAELVKAGPATADFGDIIDRGKATIQNFTDNLAVVISQNPVVMAGMRAVGEAIDEALGANQASTIQTTIGYVESFAIGVTHAADICVEGARVITAGFNGLKILFNLVATGVMELFTLLADFQATLFEGASKLPVIGSMYQGAAKAAREMAEQVTAVRDSFADQTQDAVDHALEQEAGFGRAHDAIAKVRNKMIEARDATHELAKASDDGAASLGRVQGAAELTSKELEQMRKEMTMVADENAEIQQQIIDKSRDYQEQLVLLNKSGLDRQLADIDFKHQKELESLEAIALTYPEKYAEMAVQVDAVYAAMSSAAVASFASQTAGAVSCRDAQIAAAREAAAAALVAYNDLLASGQATHEQLTKSHAAMVAAQDNLEKIQHKARLDQMTELASAASTILRSIFGKNKAAAIAAAIIDTAAAVAKALAAYPWPFSLGPAAAAAAAGYAPVQAIRRPHSDGFAEGTPDTAFGDFGRGSMQMLHGREAVVNFSQAETLQEMVLAAVQSRDDRVLRQLERMDAAEDQRARMLPRAIRDAVLMAG